MMFKRLVIVVGLLGTVGNSVQGQDSRPDRWAEALSSWKTIDQQSTLLDYKLWEIHSRNKIAKSHWDHSFKLWSGISINTMNYQEIKARVKWNEAWRAWGRPDNWRTAKRWFSAEQH